MTEATKVKVTVTDEDDIVLEQEIVEYLGNRPGPEGAAKAVIEAIENHPHLVVRD